MKRLAFIALAAAVLVGCQDATQPEGANPGQPLFSHGPPNNPGRPDNPGPPDDLGPPDNPGRPDFCAPPSDQVSCRGALAYVVNGGSDDVSVISTTTNTVVATVGVGTNPRAIAIKP